MHGTWTKLVTKPNFVSSLGTAKQYKNSINTDNRRRGYFTVISRELERSVLDKESKSL
jgi:hypothetical protein